MDQSKSFTRMLRVLRKTALVQLFQSTTVAYMLLVREADCKGNWGTRLQENPQLILQFSGYDTTHLQENPQRLG